MFDRFIVGERVLVRASLNDVPDGTTGTVERVYLSVPGLREIRLDCCGRTMLLHVDQLAPIVERSLPTLERAIR